MTVVAAKRVNLRETAQILRVTPQTLYNWRNEGCPVEEGIAAIREWLSARKSAWIGDIKERRAVAEAELAEQKVVALKRENDVDAGKLADIEEIVAELAELLTHAKPLLESMVDDIAKETPQELRVGHRKIAKDAADRFLRKLSQWRPGETRGSD